MADKRNFWQRRRNWQRGLIIGFIFWFIGCAYYAVDTYHYTGICGQSSPVVEKKHSCTVKEYLFSDYRDDFGFLLVVLVQDFWYVVLALLIVPAVIGYGIDVYFWGKSNGTTKTNDG